MQQLQAGFYAFVVHLAAEQFACSADVRFAM